MSKTREEWAALLRDRTVECIDLDEAEADELAALLSARPEPRDWKTEEAVKKIYAKLDALCEAVAADDAARAAVPADGGEPK